MTLKLERNNLKHFTHRFCSNNQKWGQTKLTLQHFSTHLNALYCAVEPRLSKHNSFEKVIREVICSKFKTLQLM